MSRQPLTQKEHLKKERRKLYKSMDFVSDKFLAGEKAALSEPTGRPGRRLLIAIMP